MFIRHPALIVRRVWTCLQSVGKWGSTIKRSTYSTWWKNYCSIWIFNLFHMANLQGKLIAREANWACIRRQQRPLQIPSSFYKVLECIFSKYRTLLSQDRTFRLDKYVNELRYSLSNNKPASTNGRFMFSWLTLLNFCWLKGQLSYWSL